MPFNPNFQYGAGGNNRPSTPNSTGTLNPHRENGPALISNNSQSWFVNGKQII